MFSSESFVVFGLSFGSLVYFEFIFVLSAGDRPSFLLLHFPAPFVEKTALFPWNGLGSFVKSHLTLYARV